jgi:hypothetical protein
VKENQGVKGMLRFDRGHAGEPRRGSNTRGLLVLFRKWIAAATRERRQSGRHETGRVRVWLGGWPVGREFVALSADLRNLSRGGARIHVNAPLPPGLEKVWLGLDAPSPAAGVPAQVLEVLPVAQGRWQVRLAFGIPCPHQLIEAAVCIRSA